jgi:hypothetical protein
MITVVRFSCGCIGTTPNKEAWTYILVDCTLTRTIGFTKVQKTDKYEVLSDDDQAFYLAELDGLTTDGLRFRRFKETLREWGFISKE